VVVWRRITRSDILGNGKSVPHPQEAVETAGWLRQGTGTRRFARIKALLCRRFIAYDPPLLTLPQGGRATPINDKISANICRNTARTDSPSSRRRRRAARP
jgi:hypothetical protein